MSHIQRSALASLRQTLSVIRYPLSCRHEQPAVVTPYLSRAAAVRSAERRQTTLVVLASVHWHAKEQNTRRRAPARARHLNSRGHPASSAVTHTCARGAHNGKGTLITRQRRYLRVGAREEQLEPHAHGQTRWVCRPRPHAAEEHAVCDGTICGRRHNQLVLRREPKRCFARVHVPGRSGEPHLPRRLVPRAQLSERERLLLLCQIRHDRVYDAINGHKTRELERDDRVLRGDPRRSARQHPGPLCLRARVHTSCGVPSRRAQDYAQATSGTV